MKVVGHVDHVVDILGEQLDWKGPEVPVRSWCGKGHGLLRRNKQLQSPQQTGIIPPLGRVRCGDAGDIGSLYFMSGPGEANFKG